jgi:GTPase
VKFIDEAIVTVESGKGGSGCVSFRRERYVPRGGPDGGDGGKGGDVIFVASPKKRTLYQFRFRRLLKADNGAPGQGKQKFGRSGDDLIIEIPPGTLARDAETNELVFDFKESGSTLVMAKGGRGGQGNARFKSSTNRSPRFAQPGEPGQTRALKLELKLLADVGIIGFPNAGKSTLIAALSSATPKIAPYPFTTLSPTLGVVYSDWGEPFVMADIPGLIEGAHEGAGLGMRFLRHVERTRILVHLIDSGDIDPTQPLERYLAINRELSLYGEGLITKPQIVVLNKIDLPDMNPRIEAFMGAFEGPTLPLMISAERREGFQALITRILQLLDASNVR